MQQRWHAASPHVLSLTRAVLGMMFAQHGCAKLFGMFGGTVVTAPLMVTAGWLELVGGTLIMVGLLTRPSAFVMSGMMAVAYFMAHASHGFWPIVNKGEPAVLYCFVFFYLAFAGGGSVSLDAWLLASRNRKVPQSPPSTTTPTVTRRMSTARS